MEGISDVRANVESSSGRAAAVALTEPSSDPGLIAAHVCPAPPERAQETTACGAGQVLGLEQHFDDVGEVREGSHAHQPSPNPNPSCSRAQGFEPENPTPSSTPLDALALACAAQGKGGAAATAAAPPSPAPKEKRGSGGGKPRRPGADSVDPSARDVSSSSPDLLSDNDVLCGRGGLTNHHPGNVFFRRLVRTRREDYLRASKRDKAGVARDIVESIRNLDPPGRFLKKDPRQPGVWVEIGNRKAREKTSQALREGAPELREELSHLQERRDSHPQEFLDGTRATSSGTHQAPPPAVRAPPPLPPLGLYTSTAITATEMEQASLAALGRLPRARVVSSDDGAGGGFYQYEQCSPRQYFPQTSGASPTPHAVEDGCFATTPTATAVAPTMVTPSTPPSAYAAMLVEPMDTSGAPVIPEPPLFSGTKRKVEHHDQPMRSPRGPRLRIFKERMMELCE